MIKWLLALLVLGGGGVYLYSRSKGKMVEKKDLCIEDLPDAVKSQISAAMKAHDVATLKSIQASARSQGYACADRDIQLRINVEEGRAPSSDFTPPPPSAATDCSSLAMSLPNAPFRFVDHPSVKLSGVTLRSYAHDAYTGAFGSTGSPAPLATPEQTAFRVSALKSEANALDTIGERDLGLLLRRVVTCIESNKFTPASILPTEPVLFDSDVP